MVLEKLQPMVVWDIFENLLVATPRPSTKTDKIRNAIKNWVSDQNKKSELKISIFEDAAGNLLMKKPATPGMETVPSILLQCHMDMVTETDRKEGFDFDNLSIPIRIQENGEWIDADGTTLGADDGIGVALALALLCNDEKDFPHGPLEVLITVDEEMGLVGALKLDVSILPIKSKFMINIDSEQFGTIIIGSAGSGGTVLTKKISKNDLKPTENYIFLQLKVFGLIGGHSGAEIHLPRANANKLIARLLTVLMNNVDVYLSSWDGGRKSSAITRESIVKFAIPAEKKDLAEKLLSDEKKTIMSYYKNKTYNNEVIEPNINIDWNIIAPESCFSLPESKIIISTASIAPHGVVRFSPTVKNLVETSNNLAIIKTSEDGIMIQLSSRSNKDSEKDAFRNSMYQLGQLGNWDINQRHSYFAWEPDPNSKFPQFFKEYYEKSFGPDVQVTLIHAGLETGIIGGKIPGLQMIAIGPDVKDLHTPNERLNIKSVGMLYDVLKNALSNFGKFKS